MGNTSALRKLSYASPSLPKILKGRKYYLLFVMTLDPSPKANERKKMIFLVTRFVDDGPLSPLLINLCDLQKLKNIYVEFGHLLLPLFNLCEN